MANIIQAAKWMQEGKAVRRDFMRNKGYFETDEGDFIHWVDEPGKGLGPMLVDMICPSDLLADDWEIVTTPTPQRESGKEREE